MTARVLQALPLLATDARKGIRVAAAQFAPALGDAANNALRIDALLGQAVRNGAGLVVFPECALTGYNFADRVSALSGAIAVDGPEIAALVDRCGAYQTECVVGTLLREGDRLFNVALLLGAAGVIGRYDKAHLPFCGADRFAQPGDTGFHVIAANVGQIGMLIGYDLWFPEAARKLALAGAEIIALPANWPAGAEAAPGYAGRARASENGVFLVACNRVGEERATQFIGQSSIISPSGARLADASVDAEHIIIAEIDPRDARSKKNVVEAGEFEMDFFADRRPELYGAR